MKVGARTLGVSWSMSPQFPILGICPVELTCRTLTFTGLVKWLATG